MDPSNKYNIMEPTLQRINKSYVTLKQPDIKKNNEILLSVLSQMTRTMTTLDNNFKKIFNKVFYGGSFYDDLKVGSPNEFDIDLLLTLPKCESCWLSCNCVELKTSEVPGFIYLKIEKKYSSFLAQYTDAKNYLQTDKIRNWFKSLVHRALNALNLDTFIRGYSTSGPAVTLHVWGSQDEIIDVDLVPCISFGADKWPKNGFRTDPTNLGSFFIVPKNPKDHYYPSRFWRLSFQQQERKIISSKERLKPALRLLKKTRNTMEQSQISSYYLKTIVLWEVSNKPSSFWNNSLSFIFMHLLKKYGDYLEKGEIQYFWNKKNNLLAQMPSITRVNHSNRIRNIINSIERHLDDPFFIAKIILEPSEYSSLVDTEGDQIVEEVRQQQSTCILL